MAFFFDYVQELVVSEVGEQARLYDGLHNRRWLPFHNYPLTDFMRFAHNAACVAYPSVPTGEGLRRIGWRSFPAFAATMAGRVVLFAFGQKLEHVVESTPRSYAITLPGAVVKARRIREQHFEFEMRNVHSFVDTYHVGVIEGAIRELGGQPQITVRNRTRRCDADFDVRWS